MAYSVLYVDDNKILQDFVRQCAEHFGGITVTAEPSAARALDLLASGSFDAVIADYDMPEMDGITFLKTVRSRFGDFPFVIFFSPHHNPAIIPEAILNGAISVHFVPFSLADFREIIRELTAAIVRRRGEQEPQGATAPPVKAAPGILQRTQTPAPQAAPAAAITGTAGRREGPSERKLRQEGSVPAPVSAVTGPQAPEPDEWEERFRVLAENLPNAVLLMDRGLHIRYASPQVPWRLGKNPHLQVIGKTPAEIGLPNHVVRLWKDAAEEVFSSGKLRETEFRLTESSEPVCWTLAPVHGPDGSVMQVLIVDRWKIDLTDETSCRAALKKFSLLSGINRHEICNQATVIAAILEMIKITSEEPRIHEHCRRIREKIDTICERVNVSRFYLDIVPRELRWQEVAAVLAPLKVPDHIRLEAVLPLPVVFADTKLPVVFSSLISYTGKYSGGVSLIRISARETPDGCVIRVEDNGTGIPEEEKKRIFCHSYSDHRDFDIGITAEILSETHIGIQETGTPGKGIRFEMRVPKGWYRFGPVPAQPGVPPAPTGGKKE